VRDWQFNPAAEKALCQLCEYFPGTPFLALGQTVFWDEPTKAFFVKMLEKCVPKAEFWHGIHDTDYFSRIPRPLFGPRPFVLVEHNDSSTRGLWVAMCEASRLFGAEVVPTRARLRQYGCNLKKALAGQPNLRSLEEMTSAWGWKGIAAAGERELAARDVMAADLAEELVSLVKEAMTGTLEAMVDSESREKAAQAAEGLLAALRKFIGEHPGASLTQLYQHMLSHFYELLLGEVPRNLKITASSSLFRFNRESAGQPRFAPLGLFLNPQTRHLARRAYDEAVAGSGIYTLEHFGADAIPFDLVIPGQGRGTICVAPDQVVVHTPQHYYLSVSKAITEPAHLAETLSESLGDDIALVGKAVILIPMIAQEFILVFHKGASAYTEHTHEFVDFLEREGIPLDCHPILRLCHKAWEGLGAVKSRLHLPEHLAGAFGKQEVAGDEFSSRWRQVVESQRALLQSLAEARKPAALFKFFSEYFPAGNGDGKAFAEALEEYLLARQTLARFGGKISAHRQEGLRLRTEAYLLRREIQKLEAEKGRHFRESLRPLLMKGLASEADEARRRTFQEEIENKRASLHSISERLHQVKELQRRLEKTAEFIEARRAARSLEEEAEAERLRLVRNIILAAEGLEQTNRRPTAWWFLLLSPEGKWFRELARTSKLEVESFCRDKKEVGG
jgi:hypothetical protein